MCHAVRWVPNLWELKQSQEREEDDKVKHLTLIVFEGADNI